MQPNALRTTMLALIFPLLLTACSPGHSRPDPVETLPHDASDGGQTLQQMQEAVSKIPGLTIEEADGGEPPNIKGYSGYQFSISVDPGWEISRGPELVTFLAQSAWSVREGYLPNGLIALEVWAGTGSTFDIAESASLAGWITPRTPHPDASGYTSTSIVMYDGSPARERLGPWPGPVPTLPPDLTARIPSSESTPHG